MLHLPLKGTKEMELQVALFRFVEMGYSKEQAHEHREAFASLHQLRERVRQLTLTEKGADEAVQVLTRYYRQITTMRSRFGSAVDEADSQLEFKWRDAFRPQEKCGQHNVQLERTGVLFNLAAALSFLGSLQKHDADGLRTACQARRPQGTGPRAHMTALPAARCSTSSTLPAPSWIWDVRVGPITGLRNDVSKLGLAAIATSANGSSAGASSYELLVALVSDAQVWREHTL